MDLRAQLFHFAQVDRLGHHPELSSESPREEKNLRRQPKPRASMKDEFGALDRASCPEIPERGARLSLLNRQRFHNAVEQL